MDGEEEPVARKDRDLPGQLLNGGGVVRSTVVTDPENHEGGVTDPFHLGKVLGVETVFHDGFRQVELHGERMEL